ncbi:protein kinase [Rubripirellula sp.]|nr:protein kinase [Rubripirellula sp.]MDB4749388.1 protein kinase [Rubripirellula sp.]
MGNNSNSQDDDPKRVPPENEADDSRDADQASSDENRDGLGHGTVGDVEDAGGAIDDPDATVLGIESMDLQEETDQKKDAADDQGDGTVGDVSEVEASGNGREVQADLDATIVDIDPTVACDAEDSDGTGTVAGLDSVEVDSVRDVPELDPNSTLEELDLDAAGEIARSQPSADLESAGDLKDDGVPEADLDATVNEIDATFLVDDASGGEAEPENREPSSEDIDKTIMEGDIDQTVMTGPDGDLADDSDDGTPPTHPIIRSGGGGNDDGEKVESTISDAQEATYDGYESHPSVQTVDSSVLESADIGQTINPRELSDEEASAWNLAAQGEAPKAGQTVQSGTGPRRTWVDYQFSRLRERAVSTGKQKQNVDDDYRLVRKLGQGGMGDVYVARQGSLNRLLALKLIKPLDGERRAQLERLGKLESVEEERKQQFLSEAIVTGDLDHPNIVPIHDVAVTSDNELFYSMKRVVGTPWSKVIKKNSREENLEILMKSCDAIAFAHERGVVHRDIKPENIMLGDFGVVMVMDWGLALPTSNYDKHDSIFATSGLGGTPAFMAPEMVTGPLEKIGPPSDIYLLGATLFMIVTGSAPHKAKTVTECLKSVRRNTIRKVSAAQQGELLNIAMRAMATKPEDRYPDVAGFQNDIRAYREHAESISLTVRATEDLNLGQHEASYAPLSRAAFRYEEALKSWPENEKAAQGLEKTKLVHAKIACEKGDYEFGLSLLDRNQPAHQKLIASIEAEIATRDSHAAKVDLLRKVAIAMLAVILVGGALGSLWIDSERRLARAAEKDAVVQKEKAVKAEKYAVVQKVIAEDAEKEAVVQKEKAEDAKKDAVVQKEKAEKAEQDAVVQKVKAEDAKKDAIVQKEKAEEAEQEAIVQKEKAEEAEEEAKKQRQEAIEQTKIAKKQKTRAEYEEYISKIALAKARLERNEADGAREILKDLNSNVNAMDRAMGWEWRWLWRQSNQSKSLSTGQTPIIDLAVSRVGRIGAVAFANGEVQGLRLVGEQQVVEKFAIPMTVFGDQQATSVAISSQGKKLAIGTASGKVFVVAGLNDLANVSGPVVSVAAHKRGITDMCFGKDGTLWTASEDRSVRSWKQAQDGSLVEDVVGWHFLPVLQIALADQGRKTLLAAVVGDGRSGKIVVWEQTQQSDGSALQLLGRMSDHPAPPSAVTFDMSGQRVASGDLAGNVLVWNTSDVSAKGEEEYRKSIEAAVQQTLDTSAVGTTVPTSFAKEVGVALKDIETVSGDRFVSSASPLDRDLASAKAHADAIETIRFSADGELLLTASDDYTLKLWDLGEGEVSQTFKGHGGWVVGADFVPGQGDFILSASDDATVRLWNPATYVGAFKSQQTGGATRSNLKTLNPREEIWSASFAPGGKQIVIARGDHKAEVIRIDEESLEFRQVSELSLDEGTDFVAMSMQVDQLNGLLYVGSGDETIRVWDLERAVQVGAANKTGLNTAFALSWDGLWLLTGSSDSNLRGILWRLDPSGKESPQIVHKLQGKPGQEGVSALAISPDSKSLFTGDDFGIGLLWDIKTGQQIGAPMVNLRGSRINDAVFSNDGKSIFVAADDAAVTQIDLQTRLSGLRFQQIGYVVDLSLSQDNRYLLTVCETASERYVKTFATFLDIRSGLGRVLDLTVTPRSSEADSVSRSRVTSARFGAESKTILVSRTANENDKSEIRVWNVDRLLNSDTFLDSEQLKRSVLQATRSTNGGTTFVMPSVRGDTEGVLPLDDQRVLTMNNNGVFLWNLGTKREEKSYRSHAELTEAAFSFDAKYVATASRSVKIWDAVSGMALAKIESDKPIRTIQFSPVRTGATGYMFATGGDEGVVKFWEFNPQTREVMPFNRVAADNVDEQTVTQTRPIQRIRFSKDGDRLWIVGDQGLARFRHLRNAAETITFQVPDSQSLRCAAISEDGAFIAAGSNAKNVLVWQLPQAGRELKLVTLSGHAGMVNDVGLIGSKVDTLRVVSASKDGTARVWDPRFTASSDEGEGKGREIISLRRHDGDVTALDTTLNGDLLMTAGSDGEVVLWPADSPRENVGGNP